MLHFMYWRLRIRMWCTLFHFDSCPEKKLVNNCLDIDHSCSHLPAVNPAIFQGVTFNNFGSGLIYGSKKKKSTKCHFQTSFVLSYALCQYNVRLSATQKENANYPPTAWHKSCQQKYLLATTLVQSVSLSPEVDEQIQIIASWCSCFNLPLFSVSFFLPSI